MFFGLPRTFEKCSKNIKEKIINNKNNIDINFTVVISTDNYNNNTEKWKNSNKEKIDNNILEDKLKKMYNIKSINYLNGPISFEYNNIKRYGTVYERLKQLLIIEWKNNY